MMKWSLVLLMCILASAKCDWLRALTAPDGLDLAGGVNVKLKSNLTSNTTDIVDKYGLDVAYQSLGVSVRKVPDKDVLQVGFFYKDKEEGREKKMGEAMFPIIMGVKITGLLGITLIGITIFVTKAFLMSKLALFIGLGLLVAKLIHNEPQHERVELDHPPYFDYTSGGYGTSGADYNSYSNYGYSTTGQVQEQSAEASQYPSAPSNDSSAVPSGTGTQQAAAKRRDPALRRRVQLIPAYITVKEYSVQH